MLRVYRRLIAAGDRALADEVAVEILTPVRDALRSIDRKSDLAGWARQNERIADIMGELGRDLMSRDYMKDAYDSWVGVDDRQSACRCALKLAHICYFADQEKDAVSWTDKVIESGSAYAATTEAYRLQVKALRSLDRLGAAQDSLKCYLEHIEKYSGGCRAEFAAHRIMSAALFFEIESYEACLRALNDWYEFTEDKVRAKPFLDANTGVVLAKILLLDQASIMLEAAANQANEDSYRLMYPSDYSDFLHYFGSYDPKDPNSVPRFVECIIG